MYRNPSNAFIRPAVITGLVFSIFAIIISIVGAIVDGIAAAVLAAETGCVNTDDGSSWGTTEGKADAVSCALGWYNYAHKGNTADATAMSAADKVAQDKHMEAFYSISYNRPYSNNNNFFYNHPNWIFYYNVNHYYNWYQTHNTYYWTNTHTFYNSYYYLHHGGSHNNNFYYNHPYYNHNNYYNNYYNGGSFSYQCVCTDNTVCYGYDLSSGSNCGSILTTYTDLLSTSTAILVVLVLLSFIYSIFTCLACGSTNSYAAPPVAAPTPVQMVQMTPQAGGGQNSQPYAPVPVVTGHVPQQQPVAYTSVDVSDGTNKEALA